MNDNVYEELRVVWEERLRQLQEGRDLPAPQRVSRVLKANEMWRKACVRLTGSSLPPVCWEWKLRGGRFALRADCLVASIMFFEDTRP